MSFAPFIPLVGGGGGAAALTGGGALTGVTPIVDSSGPNTLAARLAAEKFMQRSGSAGPLPKYLASTFPNYTEDQFSSIYPDAGKVPVIGTPQAQPSFLSRLFAELGLSDQQDDLPMRRNPSNPNWMSRGSGRMRRGRNSLITGQPTQAGYFATE